MTRSSRTTASCFFPVEDGYWSGNTLGELRLTWYGDLDPEESVAIVNTLWQRAHAGETVFYDIYTEAEKAADPAKADTGLFFFRGEPGAPFALCNAGGGFAYDGLHAAYAAAGWRAEEIDRVLQLQIPDAAWFAARGITGNYHGGANVVFDETEILEWIISHSK